MMMIVVLLRRQRERREEEVYTYTHMVLIAHAGNIEKKMDKTESDVATRVPGYPLVKVNVGFRPMRVDFEMPYSGSRDPTSMSAFHDVRMHSFDHNGFTFSHEVINEGGSAGIEVLEYDIVWTAIGTRSPSPNWYSADNSRWNCSRCYLREWKRRRKR
jgi:hypothetical protein